MLPEVPSQDEDSLAVPRRLAAAAGPGGVRGWVGAGGVGEPDLEAWRAFSGTENPGHAARNKVNPAP